MKSKKARVVFSAVVAVAVLVGGYWLHWANAWAPYQSALAQIIGFLLGVVAVVFGVVNVAMAATEDDLKDGTNLVVGAAALVVALLCTAVVTTQYWLQFPEHQAQEAAETVDENQGEWVKDLDDEAGAD